MREGDKIIRARQQFTYNRGLFYFAKAISSFIPFYEALCGLNIRQEIGSKVMAYRFPSSNYYSGTSSYDDAIEALTHCCRERVAVYSKKNQVDYYCFLGLIFENSPFQKYATKGVPGPVHLILTSSTLEVIQEDYSKKCLDNKHLKLYVSNEFCTLAEHKNMYKIVFSRYISLLQEVGVQVVQMDSDAIIEEVFHPLNTVEKFQNLEELENIKEKALDRAFSEEEINIF